MATEQEIADGLNEAFGITVPAPFVQMVCMAARYGVAGAQDVADRSHRFPHFFEVLFSFDFAAEDIRSPVRQLPRRGLVVIPPEFLEFGGSLTAASKKTRPWWKEQDRRSDTLVHYGFVVHAPELGHDDHPVGEFRTFDGQPILRLGDDTRSGLEFVMSRVLHRWAEDPTPDPDTIYQRDKDRSDIDALAAEIGVTPSPAKGGRPPERITPTVPSGWRHVPSSDGVGVLAPEGAFADRPPIVTKPGQPVGPAIDDALIMVESGHPATALLGLRETWWHHPRSYDIFNALRPAWCRVYRALDRPLLAQALERTDA
jgi:hypothetical protein